MPGHSISVVALFLLGLVYSSSAIATAQQTVEALLAECAQHLGSVPERAETPLEKLQGLQSTFTPAQRERYHLYLAGSLGYRGRHEERVTLVQAFLGQVKTPATRASFLYELIDGSRTLGKYESALHAMNESILLLPSLERTKDKITVLQGAVSLLYSFHAFDEALVFAERIYALDESKDGSYAKCVGLTDKVDLHFLLGNGQLARSLVPDAISACDANKNLLFTLIVKAYAVIDLVDTGKYSLSIDTGLPLFDQFLAIGMRSNLLTALEDALARAYLKTGNTDRAEHFGLQAYQRAQLGKALQWQEKTSETMAAIKRSQGQLAAAIGYYDINLALKKKVLDDQLHKNLAYQRVKFETQDKANQMALLEQKNKTLSIEKELHQGKYQNLILLLTLGLVVLTILGAWLVKTLRQKNIFRVSAQVDGLTQVSNRAHFTACAQQAFARAKSGVSLVLFDMDFFKKINDTYGHATGDWVLKTVCHTVKAQLRKGDMVGRLGGEEFALCLPASTDEEVLALAERCRAAIAVIDTSPSGFTFVMTASFGIASRGPGEQASYEETLVSADKALYLSKNEGRNRVTVYQHSAAH